MRSQKQIEELVELLFHDCCFDPLFMDEAFCKEQFRTALTQADDQSFEWIRSKYYGPVAQLVVAED